VRSRTLIVFAALVLVGHPSDVARGAPYQSTSVVDAEDTPSDPTDDFTITIITEDDTPEQQQDVNDLKGAFDELTGSAPFKNLIKRSGGLRRITIVAKRSRAVEIGMVGEGAVFIDVGDINRIKQETAHYMTGGSLDDRRHIADRLLKQTIVHELAHLDYRITRHNDGPGGFIGVISRENDVLSDPGLGFGYTRKQDKDCRTFGRGMWFDKGGTEIKLAAPRVKGTEQHWNDMISDECPVDLSQESVPASSVLAFFATGLAFIAIATIALRSRAAVRVRTRRETGGQPVGRCS
jgi:hypothetical protein